jgi:hypothetical protein
VESEYTGWCGSGADDFDRIKSKILDDIDDVLSPALSLQFLTSEDIFITLNKKLVEFIYDFKGGYIDQD